MSKGVLYVVATPIGNLEDLTTRAAHVLRDVDLIAAEDTRHTRVLLQWCGVNTPMLSLHEHNEQERATQLLARLEGGENIALVSDAGTPLISDPGYPLVSEARARGISVVPIPGASALISALCASGLPTDQFLFAGFPPRQSSARLEWLERLAGLGMTLVFYESSHRIDESLAAMRECFGAERPVVIARELTKLHETFLHGSLDELLAAVREDPNQRRGEFVILVQGNPQEQGQDDREVDRVLKLLGAELPVKQAARLAAEITGRKKNDLYQRLLTLHGEAKQP